jgi:hypothetical protein
MFRSTGAVLGVALIVLALEFSPDKAAGLRAIFVALAAVLLAAIPLVFLIPDTARDRRLAEQRDAASRAGSEPVAGPAVASEH